MIRVEVDVVVVGAGPAGLLAAAELADAGMRTAVVDESVVVGGQISRRPLYEHDLDASASWARPYRRRLARLLGDSRVQWYLGHTVWGIFDNTERPTVVTSEEDAAPQDFPVGPGTLTGFTVATQALGGQMTFLGARRVILATGAYDAPVAVPGWTLPGVIGAGALQTLAKAQGLANDSTVVVAGSHPLAILAADHALRAGIRVAAVLVSQSRRQIVFAALRSLTHPRGVLAKAPELFRALRRIRRQGTPLLIAAEVARVEGTHRVEGVAVRHGRRRGPRAGESRIACDIVGMGYGLLVNSELARQVGCKVSWDLQAGGWIVTHDIAMETSRPGLHVAGESTGVSGAEAAAAEGSVAGLAVTAALTSGGSSRFRGAVRARRRAQRWNTFGALLRSTAHQDASWHAAAMTPDSLLCRCESVTRKMVEDVARAEPDDRSPRQTKMLSRLGMGPCQARYCGPLLKVLEEIDGTDPGELTVRVPVKPFTMPVATCGPRNFASEAHHEGDLALPHQPHGRGDLQHGHKGQLGRLLAGEHDRLRARRLPRRGGKP